MHNIYERMFIYKNKDLRTCFCINKIYYYCFDIVNIIDDYNIIYFALNGILIWLNILHINIILVKYSFLILLNNLEYLILIF